jgi:putative ABC transport system substrate-binding protein
MPKLGPFGSVRGVCSNAHPHRNIDRRAFVGTFAGSLLAVPLIANPQQVEKVARVGVLSTTWGSTSPILQGFKEGLKELGYIEGRNLVIEVRNGEGRNDRLPALAAELVGLRVDVIVTGGPYALQAAKNATATIPIVFAGVGANFAPARSGGNLTGVAEEIIEATGKRLTLLKEAVPSLMRIAILANPDNYGTEAYLQECRAQAQAVGVALQVYEVRDPNDISPAFAKMVSERAEGLVAFTDSIIFGQREKIVQTALKNRLPGSYPYREWVTDGGLLSYGPNLTATMREPVPIMVREILKGAKPSEIPLEHPKSEIFINLKTASALGLTIPQSVLLRADEAIE